MDTSFITNKKLRTYVNKNLDYPTVILCFLCILEKNFANPTSTIMSKTEVELQFNSQHQDFGVNTFRRDYLKRQSGDPKNAINENSTQRFFFRPEFFTGLNAATLRKLAKDIREHYKTKLAEVTALIGEISAFEVEEDQEKVVEFIKALLMKDEGGAKRGQNFEIGSYSILKAYFESFGFNLNRFSTTYANDGGMDFVGQYAIYQVATEMTLKKINEDIIKTPGIGRIIVYKKLARNFDIKNFSNDLILRTISVEELFELVDGLASRSERNYAHAILTIAKSEYMREHYTS